MSDGHFDALRSVGEYPPKGWGFKDNEEKRKAIIRHLERPESEIVPWMKREILRLLQERP